MKIEKVKDIQAMFFQLKRLLFYTECFRRNGTNFTLLLYVVSLILKLKGSYEQMSNSQTRQNVKTKRLRVWIDRPTTAASYYGIW